MNPNEIRKISKAMSLALRHNPSLFKLEVDRGGWCDVESLITQFNKKGIPLDQKVLEVIVAQNDKKRFTFNEEHNKIRANQGHSIPVDLEMEAIVPPAVLYHGTASRFVGSIRSQGLLRQKRNHVHLSDNPNTAKQVGQRHGKAVILLIDAARMHEEGHLFYQSLNKVWLTAHVPVQYITIP
jgi:putative RNA 2'-phosphotransferase